MMGPSSDSGQAADAGVLFDRYKERLRRTVRLRLDRRLIGIIDTSVALRPFDGDE